jgi:Tfp pilus assembly protein PilF
MMRTPGPRSPAAAVVVVALALAGCATPPAQPPAAAPVVSMASLYEQPAERSLVNGLRAYEEGAFDRADTNLKRALREGLASAHDVAVANKYLAFIACAFNRISACEQHFRDAFRAEPQFVLTEKEVGHPIWGPVYKRVRAGVGAAKG